MTNPPKGSPQPQPAEDHADTSWPYIAGRMQVFAEILVRLDENADVVDAAELRGRLSVYAGLAREALTECVPAKAER